MLTSVKITVCFFLVPPETNALTAEPKGGIIAGEPIKLTCVVGTSNNVEKTSVKWRRRGTVVTGTSTPSDGAYGGKIITSILTFNVEKEDNDRNVTCTPVWTRQEQGSLTKSHTMNVLCKYM